MSALSRYRAHRIVTTSVRWAASRDPEFPQHGGEEIHIGFIASLWATLKLGVIGILAPLWAPPIIIRAAINTRRARQLSADLPTQIRAVAAGRTPAAPNNHVLDVDASQRIAIFSDLHRNVGGRVDWPARQNTKALYEQVLGSYATEQINPWALCENGDVEDYWMVGGSTYGACYDALRILGSALARYRRNALLSETYRAHLDRIVANNESIYRRIREDFSAHGRYFRTVGNHDDPNAHPMVADHLRSYIGDVPVSDYLALRGDDGTLTGIITHGHHTDGWNAPQRDNLGKLSAWVANTMIDVPRLNTPEGLPTAGEYKRLLDGEAPDKLIAVHPTFGANSEYDSLDEELLFAAVQAAGLEDVWLIMGHTHSPVHAPTTRTGECWTHYINSGSCITDGFITAIEWDGTTPTPTVRLVSWARADDDTNPTAVTISPDGTKLVRHVLEPNGDLLRATPSKVGYFTPLEPNPPSPRSEDSSSSTSTKLGRSTA